MFLVVEKMGATAVDEEKDEVALVFWRLGGGAVAALLVPVVVSVSVSLNDIRGLVVETKTQIVKRGERTNQQIWLI